MKAIQFLPAILLLFIIQSKIFSQEHLSYIDKQEYFEIISQGEFQSKSQIGTKEINPGGQINLKFQYSKKSLEEAQIIPKNLNIFFQNVDQALLTDKIKTQNKYGSVSIMLDRRAKNFLKYSKRNNTIAGKLKVVIDASIFNQLAEPTDFKETDLALTPVIPAEMYFEIKLSEKLEDKQDALNKMNAELIINVKSKAYDLQGVKIPALQFVIEESNFKLEMADMLLFESVQTLCLQPVFIRSYKLIWKESANWPFLSTPMLSVHTTGLGLDFGIPALRNQWRKADVVFEIREPIILYNPEFRIMDVDERTDLLDLVDEDDCIEIYFVQEFNPNDFAGGGFTMGSGTASAKVVSSDENAFWGVDETHLAHEVGHVLGLRHPNAEATSTSVPGSTGTLICPSGFRNDNPPFNSLENMNLINNPLLQFSFQIRSTITNDCNESADCGSCN